MFRILPINRFTAVELNRKPYILNKIIWSVLIIMTICTGINMLIQPHNLVRYALILVLLWPVSLALLAFEKRGSRYLSAFLYVAFLVVMIFGFSWTGGGIKGHGIKFLPIVVLFAGLTLGRKEIWVFGLIAISGGLAMVLAEYFKLIPVTEPLGDSGFIYWTIITTAILLLCFLEHLSVAELTKALHETQKELVLRNKSEELLRIKNEKLTEIAFLQSHIVRKPVANVLGLLTLLKSNNPHDPSYAELLAFLEVSAKELDSVIHQIVLKTNEIESVMEER